MSCADACIDHYADVDNEFYVETVRRARKSYQCCECGEPIAPGQSYERVTGKSDGSIWTVGTCLDCREIRKAFVCGSWQFGGLWESIREQLFEVWQTHSPIDCLAKLDSKSARDKAMAMYDDWRGDA